jgi:hypothetical protein
MFPDTEKRVRRISRQKIIYATSALLLVAALLLWLSPTLKNARWRAHLASGQWSEEQVQFWRRLGRASPERRSQMLAEVGDSARVSADSVFLNKEAWQAKDILGPPDQEASGALVYKLSGKKRLWFVLDREDRIRRIRIE